MATYCISDIHGYYDKFIALINLIEFDPAADRLYILGDIIDRGPQSAEMLWYATKEAPASVYFLLGNHEDMCWASSNRYKKELSLRLTDSWSYNHGYETIEQVRNFAHYYPEWEAEILSWINQLPAYYSVKVNNTDFILVHAGLQSDVQQLEDWCPQGREGLIRIDNTPIDQDVQAMLWNRYLWILETHNWPFDIVCGHTPTVNVNKVLLADAADLKIQQSKENGILHVGRKHFIDCGCRKYGVLGCLRLDDMKEFYVENKE